VIVRGDGRTTQVHLPELSTVAVRKNAEALLTGGAAAQQVCAWLWEAVAAPLLVHGGPVMAGSAEWVFIPSGYLGMLPLHAAGSTQTGWLDDHVTVRVTPSLLALTEGHGATPSVGSPVVAISDATDLMFLAADRAVAQALIPDSQALTAQITPDTVLEALVEAPVAVVSGHAVHSLADGGGLALGSKPIKSDDPAAGTRPQWLTAEAVERTLPSRLISRSGGGLADSEFVRYGQSGGGKIQNAIATTTASSGVTVCRPPG